MSILLKHNIFQFVILLLFGLIIFGKPTFRLYQDIKEKPSELFEEIEDFSSDEELEEDTENQFFLRKKLEFILVYNTMLEIFCSYSDYLMDFSSPPLLQPPQD